MLKTSFWGYAILLLVFFPCVTIAQTPVRVMQIHYNDGVIEDIPIPLVDSISFGFSVGNDIGPEMSDSITSNEVLERAYKMASLEWTPLRPVPRCDGGYFEPYVTVTGVPYSEVKEINTYLFQDVSYHTFMTAVHSPLSVVYTVDISQPPYQGTYCATYYGAVCSSSVFWTFGFDIPYYTYDLASMPDFTVNEHQEIDSLKICDVIWMPGHVQMIYDMEYRSDTLYAIKTFETTYFTSHIRSYDKNQFINVWNSHGYVGYRYNKIKYSKTPAVYHDWAPVTYNNALCPSKGDKSVYRDTDTVIIHIYDSNYSQIVLSKEASLVSSEDYSGEKHEFYDLQPGVYNVFLQNDNDRTASVSFEIIKTDVNYNWITDDEIIVYFESSAMPKYVAMATRTGFSKYYPISDIDRWRGYITIQLTDYPEYYNLKVIFKGEYGNIINEPIRVERL